MGSFGMTSDLAEALRRANLAKQLQISTAMPNAGVAAGVAVAPIQSPVASPSPSASSPLPNAPTPANGQIGNVSQPTPRDTALSSYRQALDEKPPNPADYHPSMTRRIFAGLLGGIAGMHDPKTGYTVGHGVAYGPF